MIKILKRTKYIIIIIILLMLIIYVCTMKFILKKNEFDVSKNVVEKEIFTEESNEHLDDNQKLKVDIKGAVNNPSVYEMDKGSRVIDLINMAGGLLDNADTSLINLSKVLSDEMVIYIYTKEEVKNSNLVNTVIKVIEKECVCPNIENDGCINDKVEDTISNKEDNKLVNINTASLEELMTIPGIGKQKAEAIIKYREDNRFNTIEDIKNVSGIGYALYESIKAYITA